MTALCRCQHGGAGAGPRPAQLGAGSLFWALSTDWVEKRKGKLVCPIKMGKTKSTESTSIIAESESYKGASGESILT